MNEDGTMDNPKLRPVEAIATQDNMICLRDPLGFSDKLIFLPQDLFFIVTLFDGKHSILDRGSVRFDDVNDFIFVWRGCYT